MLDDKTWDNFNSQDGNFCANVIKRTESIANVTFETEFSDLNSTDFSFILTYC